jgi:hypothetical protein
MTLQTLLKLFSDNRCSKVYVKRLSPNDNSKNQVYLGGSFEVLNVLPIRDITSDNSGDWRRMRFKTKLDFYWINEEGILTHAPEAQLILYPKYPEVRFSGFLKGVRNAPSDLMANRIDGRLLFFGITSEGRIIGYVTPPDSSVSNEFNSLKELQQVGIFREITLQNGVIQLDSREQLLSELKRIHLLEWIDARRLDSSGKVLPCISPNCGGYTLEAELGITPNGYSEPDYLGWEIKQFNVKDFAKWQSSVITLMTPEPTHGYYHDEGVEAFIRKYGYNDKMGREARMNFGGIHKYNTVQESTGLKLIIEGVDPSSYKITNTDGYIGLVDGDGNVAASWGFASLLKHWNIKHANACYVPSMNRKDEMLYPFSKQQYRYGSTVMLGQGTDFSLVLQQIGKGNIYYDPGIKLELEMPGFRKQNIKRRSQFRIKSVNLPYLYKQNQIVNVL